MVSFDTKFTVSTNQSAVFAFSYSSSIKLLNDILPHVKNAAVDEAVSSMGPYRPRARYSPGGSTFGNRPSGNHRSLRDPNTYREKISGSGAGRVSGSVTAASDHAKVVHDGRPGMTKSGKGTLKWDNPDGSNVMAKRSVAPARGNPWMRRALGQGVSRSRYTDAVGFSRAAGSSAFFT